MTAAEVAGLLAVPESWVREHTRGGHVPHVRLGRYVRYERDEILEWVEGLTSGGGPAFRKHRPKVAS